MSNATDPPRLYAFTLARYVKRCIAETKVLSFASIAEAQAYCDKSNGYPGMPQVNTWSILDHDSHAT